MHVPARIALSGLRQLILRVVAGLMIATVGGHAVMPVLAPLERTRGSAFSAATDDISVLADATLVRKADAVMPFDHWTAFVLATLRYVGAPVIEARAIPIVRSARGPPEPALLTSILPLGPPVR
jgi:hypothetical protein